MNRPVKVYVSARAQEDNLGDVVLRRTLLHWLDEPVAELHVLLSPSSDYNDALALPRHADGYQRSGRWASSMLRNVLRARVVLVYAPGPQNITLRNGGWKHTLVNLAISAVVRLSGGSVAKVGRGYTGQSRLGVAVERAVLKSTALATLRDQASLDLVGPGRAVLAPDLALSAVNQVDTTSARCRRRACVSFRTDAGLTVDDVRGCIVSLRNTGFEPVLVTQVKRDNVVHARLAGELGCDLVAWEDGDGHQAQLERVLHEYSRSSVVVTNRLHSAIFAMNAGAVPVIYADGAHPKTARTLQAVGVGSEFVLDFAEAALSTEDVDAKKDRCARLRADAARDLRFHELRLRALITRSTPGRQPEPAVAERARH